MNELTVLGGSVVLCALVTVAAVWLDGRAIKKQNQRDKKRRPLVDFGKVNRD